MSPLKNLIKTGFGLSIGMIGAQLIFMALGLLLFVWGMSLLKKARRGQGSLSAAYVVMGLGVVLGLGLGAGAFIDEVSSNL